MSLAAPRGDARAGRRIRVLFVIGGLGQAGAERYLYEVCRRIDRDRFAVEVLTTIGQDPAEHYAVKLAEIGVPIHRKLPEPRSLLLELVPDRRRARALRSCLERAIDLEHHAERALRMRGFFDDYDIVSVVMVENFYRVAPLLAHHPRVGIHLMSARVQYDGDLYAALPRNENLRFFSMSREQEDELRGTPADGCPTFEIPLPLDMTGRENVYRGSSGPRRVCLVSRIDAQRLLEIFLWTFQALAAESDVQMVVYGGGDRASLERALRRVGIRSRVHLAGHQPDLRAMIERDQPMLVWMGSFDGSVGYGSIELASYGVPILFANYGAQSTEHLLARTDGAMRAYRTVPDLFEGTRRALGSPETLRDMGARLRDHLMRKHDARLIVPRLERHYIEWMASRG